MNLTIVTTSGKLPSPVIKLHPSHLTSRKSVRSYEPTLIQEEVLTRVLDAARLAPLAGNAQPWHFTIVRDGDKRARIAKGCRYGRFLAESPVVIVACGDKKASPNWYAIDIAIALEHLVLAVTALGLGTCRIGAFDKECIREMLKLPERFDIVALMALGYPRKKVDLLVKILHMIMRRKKLEEIVSLETYGAKGRREIFALSSYPYSKIESNLPTG